MIFIFTGKEARKRELKKVRIVDMYVCLYVLLCAWWRMREFDKMHVYFLDDQSICETCNNGTAWFNLFTFSSTEGWIY